MPLRLQRDFQFGGQQWVQPWPVPPTTLPGWTPPVQLPGTLPAYSPYDTGQYAFIQTPAGQNFGYVSGPNGFQAFGPNGGSAFVNPYAGQGQIQGPYGGGLSWQRPQPFQAFPGAPIVSEQPQFYPMGTCR
jgi:hypothetical protein